MDSGEGNPQKESTENYDEQTMLKQCKSNIFATMKYIM